MVLHQHCQHQLNQWNTKLWKRCWVLRSMNAHQWIWLRQIKFACVNIDINKSSHAIEWIVGKYSVYRLRQQQQAIYCPSASVNASKWSGKKKEKRKNANSKRFFYLFHEPSYTSIKWPFVRTSNVSACALCTWTRLPFYLRRPIRPNVHIAQRIRSTFETSSNVFKCIEHLSRTAWLYLYGARAIRMNYFMNMMYHLRHRVYKHT